MQVESQQLNHLRHIWTVISFPVHKQYCQQLGMLAVLT